ncbi:cytochrome P450 71D10-like [Vitis riparia]|uniref:cytochrome P450 71D10-like n=1 Tax=Vitis riparia TaxID=96939 RepID=UPI00155A0825|nr:cytochrome P450 71D10-like [Vitis riparia]
MKTHDLNFAQRPHLLVTRIVTSDSTDIAFAPYGDYWRQLRKICVIELLSAKRVRSFQLIRKEEVSNLIRFIDPCSRFPIDLREKISSFTFAVISKAALGKEFKEQDSLKSVLEEGTKLASGFCLADVYPSVKWIHLISGMRHKLEKLHDRIDGILQIIVDEHRERMEKSTGELEAEEDFIDVLLKLQQDGDLELPLTDDNIKAVILDIFSGGGATVSTAVEWAMSEMMKNPRVMEKAQAEVRRVFDGQGDVDETGIDELKFLKAVVSETLRLHPPFPLLLPRECREKCKINGYEVPVKTRMTINAWAIGRDPDYWTEAERFYPERFLDSSVDYKGADFGFIPFGAGRRMCPGILFAIPSIELPLAHLLFHFDWELPNGMRHEDLDMTEVHGLSAKRKHSLHLIPIPYNS